MSRVRLNKVVKSAVELEKCSTLVFTVNTDVSDRS